VHHFVEVSTLSNHISKFFSPEDLARIVDAVRKAEARTAGEIVPYVVEASDDYEESVWRAGGLTSALCLGLFVSTRNFTDVWFPLRFDEAALITLGASVIAMILVWGVRPLRQFFAGKEVMNRRVEQRAAEAFLAEEVFKTRERTGILIFVSLFEHEVMVIGDSGINTKVQRSDWEDVTRSVLEGMNSGRPADGLIEAIRKSGELLEKHGVTRRVDDQDELQNRLRTEE